MLSPTEVINRMLDPITRTLSDDVARRLAELRVDSELEAHIERLADLANEGLLTPDQRSEYEMIVNIGSVVSVLKAKARARLGVGAPAA